MSKFDKIANQHELHLQALMALEAARQNHQKIINDYNERKSTGNLPPGEEVYAETGKWSKDPNAKGYTQLKPEYPGVFSNGRISDALRDHLMNNQDIYNPKGEFAVDNESALSIEKEKADLADKEALSAKLGK